MSCGGDSLCASPLMLGGPTIQAGPDTTRTGLPYWCPSRVCRQPDPYERSCTPTGQNWAADLAPHKLGG